MAAPAKPAPPPAQPAGRRLLLGAVLALGAAAALAGLGSAADVPLVRERRQARDPNAVANGTLAGASRPPAPLGIAMNQTNMGTYNVSGVLWGPWIQYYEEIWDGPGIYAGRVKANPSLFQYNIEIERVLLPDPRPFLQGVIATGTDAAFYLTVYPFKGWEVVTEAALDDLVAFCREVIQSGRKMILRFAPEMNGTWFSYGQHPSYFKMMWMAVWNAIKADPIARQTDMMWAVNSIQGYPFCGGSQYCGQGKPWESEMDTNAPEGLDGDDDPYMPYYPGDEYVDTVGMSIYHYGIQYPWLENVVPYETKFVDMVRGRNDQGTRDFYAMFCEPPRSKAFAVAESAVATHVFLDQGVGEVAIKTQWWKQIWDAKKEFPAMYLASFFEHIKHEEATFRDFMSASIDHPNVTAAFQRSLHTNPNLVFATRSRPETYYEPYGRWPNMTKHTALTEGDYVAYDPNWGRPAASTRTTRVPVKTTVPAAFSSIVTSAAVPTAAATTEAATSSRVQATGTLTQVTPTTSTSGAAGRAAVGVAALLGALAAFLL
ncbi:hypothetical protein DFJ74DRAFT_643435 [Hyaloraphidium curvatum]|nr:hypothetical protein DFJ74DRAFT_643435 [Hyaloraphidium curvatum]